MVERLSLNEDNNSKTFPIEFMSGLIDVPVTNKWPSGKKIWNIGSHNRYIDKGYVIVCNTRDYRVVPETLEFVYVGPENAKALHKRAGRGTVDSKNYTKYLVKDIDLDETCSSVKEDFNDRINMDNVYLSSSSKMGDLLRDVDYLYDNLSTDDDIREINFTLMALQKGYEEGVVPRTAINGFMKELDNASKAVYNLIDCLAKLRNYGEHIPKDVYAELDKSNDWFRRRKK